jgi:hypothetical protein
MLDYRFEFEIQDEPCIINVLDYSEGTNFAINSASEIDNDPEEFEYEVLTLSGQSFPKLEKLITDSDDHRIYEEFKKLLDNDKLNSYDSD